MDNINKVIDNLIKSKSVKEFSIETYSKNNITNVKLFDNNGKEIN